MQGYFKEKVRTHLDHLSIPRLWGKKQTQNTREAWDTTPVLLYSPHEPIGSQPYPVVYYVVANPVRGHIEVRRSTSHIMVKTRYSDQQGSKSRQKVMRLYKQWHRSISKRFIKPPYYIHREQLRSTRIAVAYPRPAFSATNRTNCVPTSFDQQVQVFQGHTSYKNKEN